MAKVTYRNLLSDTTEFREINRDQLLSCAYEYARTSDDDLYMLIMREKVSLCLNGEIIHPDNWLGNEISSEDEIIIYPVLQGGNVGAFLTMVAGIALTLISYPLGAAWLRMMGVSLILGGISSALFAPDLPANAGISGGRETQTYNWSGIKTTAKRDMPIPVVYGTHKVGGNIISVYTEGHDKENYLSILLGLCEGEIDGICQEADYTATCGTSKTTDFNYKDPAIEINDIPLKEYDDLEWWYRKGANSGSGGVHNPSVQTVIPGFDAARMQQDDGREVTASPGIIYTTSKEVDMAYVQVRAPSLISFSGGDIQKKTIEYKIKYKTSAEGSYHEFDVPQYTASVTCPIYDRHIALVGFSLPPEGNPNHCTVTYGIHGDYVYGDIIPPTYKIQVLENNVPARPDITQRRGSYTIKLDIRNTNTDTRETKTITQYYTHKTVGDPYYENVRWEFDSWINTKFKLDKYIVEFSHLIEVGNVFQISSTLVGNVNWVPITGKTRTTVWSSLTIDFNPQVNANASGRDVYDIKVMRRYSPSSDPVEEDKLLLNSVTEIVHGNFIYPNTALLGLKIKATGQISGGIPKVSTLIRGTKIDVPSTTGGSETFDNLWWNDSESSFEDVDGNNRAWDETTYTAQYTDNAMLCIRDIITNNRYGIGQYLSTDDLYDTGIISAFKECHKLYDPYSADRPDLLEWFDSEPDAEWNGNWSFEVGNGSSDSSTRTISCSTGGDPTNAGNYYSLSFRLSSPASIIRTYTFSITLANASRECSRIQIFESRRGDILLDTLNNKGDGTHTTSVRPNRNGTVLIKVLLESSNPFTIDITDVSFTEIECADHYHTFDGVIESGQSALSIILEMCNIFRCWPVWFDGKFNFVIDKDETAIHTLTDGNIIDGSLSQTFTPLSEIPSRIEGQFADEALDYDMRSIIVSSSAGDLVKSNIRTIGLKGITNFQKAERELTYKLNKLINCTKTINLKCGLDAIHATAGDIIVFQHNLPPRGGGGRILSFDAANASITMDATYPFTNANATYFLRYQTGDNSFVAATVTTTGVAQTVTLERFPSNINPATDAVYAVGNRESYTATYRLMSVGRNKDNEVEVTALSHSNAVYSEPTIRIVGSRDEDLRTVTARTSRAQSTLNPPTSVTIVPTGSNEGIGFVLGATLPLGNPTVTETVFQMSESDDFIFDTIAIATGGVGDVKYINLNLQLNKTYYFKVFCRTGSIHSSPIFLDVLLPANAYQVSSPSGIRIEGKNPNNHTFDGKDVTLVWDKPNQTQGRNALISGYEIEVYHESITTNNLLRTITVSDEKFTYTLDDMLSDSNETIYGSSSRKLIVRIASVTVNNNKSSFSNPIEIYNGTPNTLSGLSAVAVTGGVKFQWTASAASDHKCYRYRLKVESDSWDSWQDLSDNSIIRILTATEINSYGNLATIYIEIKDKDYYNQESATATTINAVSNRISDNIFALASSSSKGTSASLPELYDGVGNSGGVVI